MVTLLVLVHIVVVGEEFELQARKRMAGSSIKHFIGCGLWQILVGNVHVGLLEAEWRPEPSSKRGDG